VLCVGGRGAEFIAGCLSKNLHPALNSRRGGGGIANEPGTGNVPETWVYFEQKGLVPTSAAYSPRATEGLLVEYRLSIDDDLRNR
jgi:hypothetical protein